MCTADELAVVGGAVNGDVFFRRRRRCDCRDIGTSSKRRSQQDRQQQGSQEQQITCSLHIDGIYSSEIGRMEGVLGQYKSTLVCPACGKVSVTFDPFMYLSLPLQFTSTRSITVMVFTFDGSNPPTSYTGELALAFGELLRKLWAPGRTPVSPRPFKTKLSRFAPQFSGYNQHDSQELLAFLLDGLHEDLNRVKHRPYIKSKDADGRSDDEVADEYWANHIARNDSIIVDVCQGQYKSTLVCPTCGKVSVTFDPFMYLSLPLQFTSTRSITVMVFTFDGSNPPTSYTVNVPKQGRCRDLIQALSNACSLRNGERLLIAEIRNHTDSSKVQLQLIDDSNTVIEQSNDTIRVPQSSLAAVIFVNWSNTDLKKVNIHHLENLPEVFKYAPPAKRTRGEPLSLYACLDAFLREEPLVPEDMWYCPRCKEQRQASKKLDLWRLPEVLVIHLKRFSFSRSTKQKLETFVNFPVHDFDLTNYIANKCSERQIYELYAVSNHYGSMASGHYTAYIKLLDENRWYTFDDSHVSAMNEEDVKSGAAYVLFYRRVRDPDGAASNGIQPYLNRNHRSSQR
ncbi:hypothetical protein ABZP36_008751 [Zizania latifolia]